MPVTARLSKAFYDRLGEDIALELVDWFNAVDSTYRADLRELNELNSARFDAKLDEYRGNLERAAVELARDWRTDRALRRLEAMLVVMDRERTFLLSGTGDLIEPDDGVLGIGSGGAYAMAAARALVSHSSLEARAIVDEAMRIAGDICIYTNRHVTIEEL